MEVREPMGMAMQPAVLLAANTMDNEGIASDGREVKADAGLAPVAGSPAPPEVHPAPAPTAAPLWLPALPGPAQHLVLASLSAADLWSLCRTSTAARSAVAHGFHAWLKDAPLHHCNPAHAGNTAPANLPLAFLAFVLGLGNPSPGSEQWRSFRKLYRRYGSQAAVPAPLTPADVADARRCPLGWDPADWNSPAYDHLMNDPPEYLVSRPLPLRMREALGQLVWSMVYWMCDSGGDPYHIRRWPLRVQPPPDEDPVNGRLVEQGHFRRQPPVRRIPREWADDAAEPDDPEEKPGPHGEESPVLRALRVRRYLDRCWTLIWRFAGPVPSEILAASKGLAQHRDKRRRGPARADAELHADALETFPHPASVCSKNLYPRMLLNLVKRGDYRTLELLLLCFGAPEKEWRTDLRRPPPLPPTNNGENGTQPQQQQQQEQKESCCDGCLRFDPPAGVPPPPGGRRWLVWFTQKGSGGPHLALDGDWDTSAPLYGKVRAVVDAHGGILGRAPVPEAADDGGVLGGIFGLLPI